MIQENEDLQNEYTGKYLVKSNFQNSDLSNFNFSNSDLSASDMRGAQLQYAILHSTYLNNTNLLGIKLSVEVYNQKFSNCSCIRISEDESIIAWNDGHSISYSDKKRNFTKTIGSTISFVESIAISPDASFILYGSSDGTLRLWDLSNNESCILDQQNHGITAIAISKDSKSLVFASSAHKCINILNLETNEKKTIDTKINQISSVLYSKCILITTKSNSVVVIVNPVNETIKRVSLNFNNTAKITLSPDGENVAGCYLSKIIFSMNINSSENKVYEFYEDNVSSVKFSNDSSLLAATSVYSMIYIWDAVSTAIVKMIEQSGPISSLFLSNVAVAVSYSNRTLCVWNIYDIKPVINSILTAVTVSKNSKAIAYTTAKNQLFLYDPIKNKVINQTNIPGRASILLFSPVNEFLIVGGSDGSIHIWNTASNEMDSKNGNYSAMLSLACNHNESVIAGGTVFNQIVLWNLKLNKTLVLNAHNREVKALCFSEKYLYSGGSDCNVRIWTENKIPLKTFHMASRVTALYVLNSVIYIGLVSGTVTVVEGKIRRNFKPHDYPICYITFSYPLHKLVSVTQDSSFYVWDTFGEVLKRTTKLPVMVQSIGYADDCFVFTPSKMSVAMWKGTATTYKD